MRKHLIKVIVRTAMLVGLLALVFASCKKTPDTIGSDLIDDNNYINVLKTDTMQIECHAYIDSIGSKNVRFALLGAMNDPVFGSTEASFYTQFRFSSAGHLFGDNAVVDSLVLQLALSSLYGDTTTMHTVHVFELTDTLSSTEPYYCYSTLQSSNIDLANGYQFTPQLKNTNTIIGGDTITQPIVRIPLNNSLATTLIQLDSNSYSHPDNFKSLFKGLYITCEGVGQNGSICSINLTNNTLTRLQLYYHDAETPENPQRYDYYITSTENYFNHFDHDYTLGSPEFTQQVLQGETALGQETAYVQAMGGIRTRIQFPNLTLWNDSANHIIINEAKLILPAPSDIDTNIFTAPQKLVLVGLNDSTTFIIPDNYEGDAYYGGSYDATTKTVAFRISEYIERVILGRIPNVGLSLGIDGASYNPYRWIVNGPNASQGSRMRVEVTYSMVKE